MPLRFSIQLVMEPFSFIDKGRNPGLVGTGVSMSVFFRYAFRILLRSRCLRTDLFG